MRKLVLERNRKDAFKTLSIFMTFTGIKTPLACFCVSMYYKPFCKSIVFKMQKLLFCTLKG